MKHQALSLLIALSVLPLASQAQWSWIDKDGRKVFSDRAPSTSVPEKNILKRPGQAPTGSEPLPAVAADVPPAAASAPKSAGLDKELEAKKKKAEQAEQDKRKAEEARIQQAKGENCNRAKAAKAGLESGGRIARFNAKGEREIMDDATRKAEIARVQSIIDSDCNP